MAYVIVEWKDDNGVSVISSSWLTPMKKEAFWPPCKERKIFNKIIQEVDPHIDNSWVLHEVKRCMYETDDFEKALKKCIEAEDTSNLESDDINFIRRRKLRARKNFSSSEDDEPLEKIKRNSERPPRLNHIFPQNKSQDTNTGGSCALSIAASLPSSGTSTPVNIPNCKPAHSNQSIDRRINNNNNVRGGSCALSIAASLPSSGTSIPVNIPNCTPSHSNQYIDRRINNNNDRGLDHNILSLLYHIKEQNDQILNHFNKKPPEVGALPNNLPVEIPLKYIDQLNELEAFLRSEDNLSGMVSYLSSLGGKDCTSKTNRILKHVFTDELASSFNFRGKRQKSHFVNYLYVMVS